MIIFSDLAIKVKEYAKNLGADLIGICHAGGSNFLKKEEKIPSSSSAIVIGCKHSVGAFKSNNIRTVQYDTYCVIQELNHMAFNLVRFLEKKEYDATAISPYVPVEMSTETKGLLGDASHRHLAEKAGLGFIGFSRLLITPNFGPRVRFASVFTSAPLEQDEEYRTNLCEGCDKKCAEACPVNAITEDGVDVRKCSKENMKYGLPGLIEFLKTVFYSNDVSTNLKNYLRDPTFWKLWQATASGMFYDCFECVKACPIGLK